MVPATLSFLAFLTLTVWGLVFAAVRSRRLAGEIDAPLQRHNGFLEWHFHILDRTVVGVVAGNLENGLDGAGPVDRKYRAQSYLRRVVALTGATQINSGYVLDVGTTRFEVRDRWVRRLRDVTDPKCMYEETCFYSANKDMPKAEEIATAMLQLKNNPALFDAWAARNNVVFKADGQVFTHAQ